jgi:hypothetical protein
MEQLSSGQVTLLEQLEERDRQILLGAQWPEGLRQLEELGYVKAYTLNIQDLVVTITDSGRAILDSLRAQRTS